MDGGRETFLLFLNREIEMVRTDAFVRSMMNKGFVDDVAFLTNGYDIQYGNALLSVRSNGAGGALLFNSKDEGVTEVVSGNLDGILHRYIVQSLFGLQNGKGLDNRIYSNVFLRPTEAFSDSMVFTDSENRKWLLQGVSPKAGRALYESAMNVNADDSLLMLDNFVVYDESLVNSVRRGADTPEAELVLLKCSLDLDEYEVLPRSECVSSVGRNIVGNFVCSSRDKVMLQNFEDRLAEITSCKGEKPSVDMSEMKGELKQMLTLTSSRKDDVDKYITSKYGKMSLRAMKEALTYDTSILSSLGSDDKVDYIDVFSSYMKKADTVQFLLKDNRTVEITAETPGIFSATFRAVPNVSQMRDVVGASGMFLTELESGLNLDLSDEMNLENRKLCSDLVKSCVDFEPASEDGFLGNSTVECITDHMEEVLSSYGIVDNLGTIKYVDRITVK